MKSMAHALQHFVIRTSLEEETPKTLSFIPPRTTTAAYLPLFFFFFFLSKEKMKLLSESHVADLKVSKPFQERVTDILLPVLVMVGRG